MQKKLNPDHMRGGGGGGCATFFSTFLLTNLFIFTLVRVFDENNDVFKLFEGCKQIDLKPLSTQKSCKNKKKLRNPAIFHDPCNGLFCSNAIW